MDPLSTQLRILILDDEPLVLSGVSMLLQSLGHTVEEAIDGEDALKLLNNGERFDLAILDLSVKNGMGALQVVSPLANIDPAMKVVVSSGFSADEVMQNYSNYGFSASLVKPFRRQDLSDLIQRLSVESR